jgi:hypothetical protein
MSRYNKVEITANDMIKLTRFKTILGINFILGCI